MQTSLWQYRQWKFVADMNGDGAFTAGDISHWAHWLLFMPGDAVIALVGPTSFGRFLDLTSVSFGSATAGWISAAVWVFGIWAASYLHGFFLDCSDPTYRQRQRESRDAGKAARREPMHGARHVGGKRRRFFWRFGMR
jgi:hypothetical protein